MKKLIIAALAVLFLGNATAQKINKIIKEKAVRKIEEKLSADDMVAAATFTPGIDKAADFIAAEFKKARLAIPDGSNSYFQEFSLVSAKQTSVSGNTDGAAINESNIVVLTKQKKH